MINDFLLNGFDLNETIEFFVYSEPLHGGCSYCEGDARVRLWEQGYADGVKPYSVYVCAECFLTHAESDLLRLYTFINLLDSWGICYEEIVYLPSESRIFGDSMLDAREVAAMTSEPGYTGRGRRFRVLLEMLASQVGAEIEYFSEYKPGVWASWELVLG